MMLNQPVKPFLIQINVLLSNNQSDPSLARPSRYLNAICTVIAKVSLFFSPSSTHRYKHWSVRALGTFETNYKMALDLDDLAEKIGEF